MSNSTVRFSDVVLILAVLESHNAAVFQLIANLLYSLLAGKSITRLCPAAESDDGNQRVLHRVKSLFQSQAEYEHDGPEDQVAHECLT